MPLDVIVDTDIGSDIDDAYAVLLAISSPELCVKGITLVHADIDMRAKITGKLLKLAGRVDIPVIPGESKPVKQDRPVYWGGHEGRDIDLSDIDTAYTGPHAPEFIAKAAADRPGELVLIPVGPLTNVAIAIRDYPNEMSKLKGIVCMGSTFNGFGPENAAREHNIACDPEAAEVVLGSGIPILLIGLNVTLQTALTRSRVEQMDAMQTPLAEMFVRMSEDLLAIRKMDMTEMHDPLAVAVAFAPDIVSAIPVRAEVNKETPGLIAYFNAGPESAVRICTSVDVDRFHEMFYARILDAVRCSC